MEDIDLKETSRRLANERDRYRAIFQSMAEPVFVVDHSFRLITVNKAFEATFVVFGMLHEAIKLGAVDKGPSPRKYSP